MKLQAAVVMTSQAVAPSSLTAVQLKKPPATRTRILIADDDALVRGSLAAVLELEGFTVDEAENGIEAVAHAVHNFPDLILLDLNMPKMDGWIAFSKIDHVRPLVPVIVITARPNQYKEAVRLGVDAFMEKPLDFPVLVRAIRKLANEPEKQLTQRITDRNFVTWLLQANQPNHS
jgi:CheY-like chemotaxis protein